MNLFVYFQGSLVSDRTIQTSRCIMAAFVYRH